jgi:hypothetical protein
MDPRYGGGGVSARLLPARDAALYGQRDVGCCNSWGAMLWRVRLAKHHDGCY